MYMASASTPGLCLFPEIPLSIPGKQEHAKISQKSLAHELPWDWTKWKSKGEGEVKRDGNAKETAIGEAVESKSTNSIILSLSFCADKSKNHVLLKHYD